MRNIFTRRDGKKEQDMTDIHFKTITHFRELGGLPTEDGRTIRHGFFFRCGELSHVSAEEQEKLAALNISKVFDLRGRDESERDVDVEGNYEYVSLPAKGTALSKRDKLYVNTASYFDRFLYMNEGRYNYFLHDFSMGYLDIPYNKDCVQPILRSLDAHKPILLHCFAGKDRTGVLAMIISAALGCSYETCKADYMLHNTLMDEELKEYHAILDKANATEWGRKAYIAVNSASEDWFDCAWYSIFNSYATIDDYLTEEMDITAEEIADWRAFYLE